MKQNFKFYWLIREGVELSTETMQIKFYLIPTCRSEVEFVINNFRDNWEKFIHFMG